MTAYLRVGVLFGVLASVVSCASSDEDITGVDVVVPEVFSKFDNAVEISSAGSFIVLRSNGIPNHPSPYFNVNDSRWAAYNGTNPNFHLNPNRIVEQQYTFRIPADPKASANPRSTPLGPIGIAANGVAIFNQYAGPSRPLTFEIDSFDQYNGHPAPMGEYHYHIEPLYITVTSGTDSLVGFLLDGFPVYGPEEAGELVTNADLDEYHGHVGVTNDYPNGIYHYHITAEDPYINGSGFYGTAGTVSG
ncbi:MAG TPA: YHYH protein [Gemmatimonadetes bacterium]|jgi:hypothetical protein|nr:YHYH protein [Gemmatimonadota bacterium]